MRRAVIAACIVALPATAAAETVKAGVAVDALTPAGTQRARVTAPAFDGGPTRLVYQAEGTSIVLSVTVGADAAAARDTIDRWRHRATRDLRKLAVGDYAYGTADHLAFARLNVAVVVRVVSGDRSAVDVARKLVAVIDAQPSGSPAAAPLEASIPEHAAVGKPVAVVFSWTPLAAELEVSGPATARRTRTGWVVARTGPGTIALRARAVDSRLRSASAAE